MADEPPSDCALCHEVIEENHREPEFGNWMFRVHWECGLRSAMGGIGHLVAHDYWCSVRHDPDAGLTYRQSAKLTAAFVAVVGTEETVRRG